MVDQTKMSQDNGSAQSPSKVVARNVAELAHDTMTIAELQVELFKVELEQYTQAATKPLAFLMISALVFLGCIPVVLLGLAFLLTELTGLSQGWSTLLVAVCVSVIAIVCALIEAQQLNKTSLALERSRAEFRRNVIWIKQVLKAIAGVGGDKAGAMPTHSYARETVTK
jgi:uncharacterized membrane protein YqjE